MLAHERVLGWQELFDLATRISMAEDDIVTTGYRIAGLHPVLNDYKYKGIDLVFRGSGFEEASFGGCSSSSGLLERYPRGCHCACAREPFLRGTQSCKPVFPSALTDS